jgi:hypothetical protein
MLVVSTRQNHVSVDQSSTEHQTLNVQCKLSKRPTCHAHFTFAKKQEVPPEREGELADFLVDDDDEEDGYYKVCSGPGCSAKAYHPYRSFYFCSKQCEDKYWGFDDEDEDEEPPHIRGLHDEELCYGYMPDRCTNIIDIDADGIETKCNNLKNPAEQFCHSCRCG